VVSVQSSGSALVAHGALSGSSVLRYVHVAWAQNICVEVQVHDILPTGNAMC
jgi:hypothetical protein